MNVLQDGCCLGPHGGIPEEEERGRGHSGDGQRWRRKARVRDEGQHLPASVVRACSSGAWTSPWPVVRADTLLTLRS
jgi:hypothetical protein